MKAGPIPFPFAFYSGINQPYIMAYTGIAGSGILIFLLLLLTGSMLTHQLSAYGAETFNVLALGANARAADERGTTGAGELRDEGRQAVRLICAGRGTAFVTPRDRAA